MREVRPAPDLPAPRCCLVLLRRVCAETSHTDLEGFVEDRIDDREQDSHESSGYAYGEANDRRRSYPLSDSSMGARWLRVHVEEDEPHADRPSEEEKRQANGSADADEKTEEDGGERQLRSSARLVAFISESRRR